MSAPANLEEAHQPLKAMLAADGYGHRLGRTQLPV
jgi:hypothetical protein